MAGELTRQVEGRYATCGVGLASKAGRKMDKLGNLDSNLKETMTKHEAWHTKREKIHCNCG